MRWWVELIGSGFELSILGQLRSTYSIENEGQRWFLVQEESNDIGREEIRTKAQDLLDLLNGALVTTGLPPVKIGDKIGRYQEDGARIQMHLVVLPMSLSVRPTVWTATEEEAYKKSLADSVSERLTLAGEDATVNKVLHMLNTDFLSWTQMYRVYEIVKKDANIIKFGWATDKQLSNFRHHANDPRATGSDSRHGVHNSPDPPGEPLSFTEANTLIRRIASEWVKTKL